MGSCSLVFGDDGDSHAAELAAGLHGFGGVGEALDEGAKLADASVVLFEGDQGLTFVKVRDGDLVAVTVLLDDLVILFDCVLIFVRAVVDLALIEGGVPGQRMIGIVFDYVGELGGGERVLRPHVVAEGGLVEIIHRWSAGARRSGT